jgi:hypothetical protein
MLRCVVLIRTDVSEELSASFIRLGPLDPQCLESPYVSISSLIIEENYVRFEVFTAVTTKNGVFWDVSLCGSCKNRRFGRT